MACPDGNFSESSLLGPRDLPLGLIRPLVKYRRCGWSRVERLGTLTSKYLLDGAVDREFRRPIIVITYDECTFPANNIICKACSRVGDNFLQPKKRGQGIMVYEFLLLFSQLNIFSLSENKQKEVTKKKGLGVL